MLNRLFFYLPKENIESYRSSFPSSGVYRPIPGTQKIHQIMNVTSKKNGVYKRNFSCLCKFCYSNDYKNCIYLDDAKFVDNKDQVRPIWHTFKEKGVGSAKVKENKDKYSSSSEDSASESEEKIDYEETEASCIVKCHDVAIVCTGDGFQYYLVKLSKDPFTTTESVKDDYGHYIPANIKVIEGNYLDIFKEIKKGDLYYLDTSKLAIISCFSVVGICPEFVEVEQIRLRKIETMSLVTHDMHQLLLEYTICGF